MAQPKNTLFPAATIIFFAAFFISSFFSSSVFALEKIDINTASPDQLDQLDGIGLAYAQRIIDGRPYSSLDDLLRVKGIGPATLQKIKDQGLACVDCGTAQNPGSAESPPSSNNAASPTVYPEPVEGPSYQYSQKILINEFLPWPEDGDKEWVELINTDNAAVNLSGWQIDDADNSTAPQVLPSSTTIAANGFLVVSFNKNTLNNDGDKVRLLWPDDQVVHSVTYDKSRQGQAVAKFDSGWLWTNQPTPGQTNKKSFIERNEAISLADATNNDKITAVEEAVVAQTGAPRIVAANENIAAPASAPENNSPADQDVSNPNLTAAAGEPIKNNSNLNSILALAGVIVLSALAAAGLIYFRRRLSAVDDSSFDD